eukprot:TRINITY_DN14113_c0_g1_i1.p1 TRINITY_DN14113_c0_g1~~TRINITY_DN14113_c0_g1_i1.p1  ORF type:complete len:374 (+),score=19.98 TRINITY_DN14113_c0_g1_i1:3-1124(+)
MLSWPSLIILLMFISGGLSAGNDRALVVQNNCSESVWIGYTGGYTQDCAGGSCPTGQYCDTARHPPGCFWSLPINAQNSKLLSAHSVSILLTAPAAGNVKWSGNIFAKTSCDSSGKSCATGESGPVSLAEFTFIVDGVDTYDISLINGVNVPISMEPSPHQILPPPSSNPYFCGNPGGVIAHNNSLVGCSWKFDTQINGLDLSTYLTMVSSGGVLCSKNSECAGGKVCGIALPKKMRSCGEKLGYWTADELCAGTEFEYPVACGKAVPGQGTQAELYGCSGANAQSCYQASSGESCCGCPHWKFNGKILPEGISCHHTNDAWEKIALPFAHYVKQACPSGYSFPFDDATSTFQCMTTSKPNTCSYTITFCPNR